MKIEPVRTSALIFILLSCLMPPAEAAPLCSRKTGLACSACHFGGTSRLTRMGRDFQIRGHRLPFDRGLAAPGASGKAISNYLTLSSKLRSTADEDNMSSALQGFAVYLGGPLGSHTSAFAQHDFYDRALRTEGKSQLGEAYFQAVNRPDAADYLWVRAGRILPYAIYAAGAGGRVSLSRPAVIGDALGGGNPYAPRGRHTGVSAGYAGASGVRAEIAVVDSEGVSGMTDLFASVEQAMDAQGSSAGLFWYRGRTAFDTPNGHARERFDQWGLLGQLNRAQWEISGAFFAGSAQRDEDLRRRPVGFYIEAARNVLPELTAFARYDTRDTDFGPSPRTTGAVIGLSQRLPEHGRAVLEFGGAPTTTGYHRRIQFEINYMY